LAEVEVVEVEDFNGCNSAGRTGMKKDTDVKDLDHLIQFRAQLSSFNRSIADDFQRIRHAWASQKDNWRDTQADRMDEQFKELWVGIERYLGHTEEHERYLDRLIRILDDARQQRI
jgi:hypothetical protein